METGPESVHAPGTGELAEENSLDAQVRAELRSLGATEGEIDRTLEENNPHLLALYLTLLPRHGRFGRREVAERAGVDVDLVRRMVRALGFPEVEDEAPIFTTADVEAMELLQSLMDEEGIDLTTVLQVVRVLGSSMARVADSQVGFMVKYLTRVHGMADDDEVWPRQLALILPQFIGRRLPQIMQLMEYVYRSHLIVASEREVLVQAGTSARVESLAIGFADLSGFTRISAGLATADLESAVERFESVAWDTVSACGGRIVKTIGDEVMFVADNAGGAVEAALDLAEVFADDAVLPEIRAGVACGPVLGRDGDYYGHAVNLASRLTDLAYPGTVLVSDSVHEAMREARGMVWKRLSPRRLKGIGTVTLWAVRRDLG